MRALRIIGSAVAVPLGLMSVGLMALAVLLADGADEVGDWWREQG